MKKHMFGVLGAFGAVAIMVAAVSADRLADPAEVLAPNPAAVRVLVGETDRLSGMSDYFVLPENAAPVAEVKALPETILREIARIGETDQMSGIFDVESEGAVASLKPVPPVALGQIERIGETDRLSGMTDYYVLPESFAPIAKFQPLSLAILMEIERVNRDN